MATLEQYQRHLDKFGPEFVLETAARELESAELTELKALTESMERTARFKAGRWMQNAMARDQRKCAECGLDLPLGAIASMKRHPHCKSTAKRRRQKHVSATPGT